MSIISQGAISRHITEYLTDQRVKHYKCKTLQNPDFFFDGRVYGAVDAAYKLDTSTEKAGGLFLRSKGIVSVGTKKADDAYKLFGLRPDENQGGSESVEWSVESIEINGQTQTINLRDRLEVSPITTKFGDNLYVQRARQRCRIMVHGDDKTESFKISFRLHLKGCTVQYRSDLDEYWIYRGGTFFCRLGKPYLVDPETMDPIEGDFVRHSLIEIGKGEYCYTKEPTEAFAKADLPASYLIDADTVYSSAADGYVLLNGATWAATHDASDGSYTDNAGTGVLFAINARNSSGNYRIIRAFFSYNLAALSGTVTAVSEFLATYSGALTSQSTQKGTQSSTLTTADYDAFSGSLYSYLNSLAAADNYSEFSYNSGGLSDVENAFGTTFLTCHRQYSYDYLNSASPGTTYYNGLYFADQTGTTKDPYLYITTAAASSYIHGIMRHRVIPSVIGGR